MEKPLSIFCCFAFVIPAVAHANPQPTFNMGFVHGAHSASSDTLFSQKAPYPVGFYLVDVYVNNVKVGHSTLTIKKDEEHQLHLTPKWLKNAGVEFDPKFYQSCYDAKTGLYRLTEQANTKIELNQQQQALFFSIPQVALTHTTKKAIWNEGHNAFLMQYYLNANKSSHEAAQFYGSGNFSVNYRAWRLMGSTSIDQHHATLPNLYVKRDIQSIKADVVMGKTNTQTQFYTSFPFIGAALYSNDNMTPWSERGYAPIISGVATSGATITISQGGYVLKQMHIPAGPYLINLLPVNNGAINVTMRYDNGRVTHRRYSVNTLPTLLRPNYRQFYVAAGVRNEDNRALNQKRLPFAIGEYAYGFSPVTALGGAIVSQHYENVLIGATKTLGWFGAVSLKAESSFSHYNHRANLANRDWRGQRLSIDYAKDFGQNTSLQASAHKYSNRHYVSFSDFDPDFLNNQNTDQQYRYDINVYQNLNWMNTGLQGEFWYANNFNQTHSSGANFYLNSTYKNANLSANVGYEKDSDFNGHNLTASLSISFPFGAGDNAVYGNMGVNYDNQSSDPVSYTAGISQSVNDRFSYSASSNLARHNNSVSLYGSYAFNQALLSGSVYQSTGGNTSYSAQLSGSVIGLHGDKHNHLIFTRNTGDTLAVVRLPNVPNVTFNGSMPTTNAGFAVTSLSSYQSNMISVDPNNLPNDIQMVDTTYNVTPTDGAIIYKKFDYVKTRTYIFQITEKNGFVVPFGTQVTTPSGQLVGYTQNHGILIARVVGNVNALTVKTNQSFVIHLAQYKSNENSVQEVKNV